LAKNGARARSNPKQVAYKILLRNATGFSSLRSALYFQLYYGKKPVSELIPFTKRRKTLSQKRKFLLSLLDEIEAQRKIILEKRRLKARAIREVEKKKIEERKARAEAKREAEKKRKLAEEKEEEIERVEDYLSKERLNKKATRIEKPTYVGREPSVLKPVKIIPVITGTSLYKKEIVLKTVKSPVYGVIDLKQLDFTLKESIWMNMDNITSVKKQLRFLFAIHVTKFFKESKDTVKGFIFRMKYNMHLSNGRVAKQGFGGTRFFIKKITDFQAFDRAMNRFYRFLSNKNMDRYLVKSSGEEIEITGFTLENIVGGDYFE